MITQVIVQQLKSLEQQTRNDYIILKDKILKEITTDYAVSYSHIADILRNSPNALSTKTIEELIKEIYDEIQNQQDPMYDSFSKGINEITSFSSRKTFENLFEIGFLVNSSLNEYNKIAKTIGTQIMDEPFYQDKLSLSDRIWSPQKQMKIIDFIESKIKDNIDSRDIANQLEDQSLTGKFFDINHSLVFGETTRAYNQTKVEATREVNNEFKTTSFTQNFYKKIVSENTNFDKNSVAVILQNVSDRHHVLDICDELAGYYRVDSDVPAIPRHERCECKQNIVILDNLDKIDKFNEISTNIDVEVY